MHVAEITDDTNTEQPWLYKGELLRWAFDLAFADPETRQVLYDEAIALLDGDGALDRLTELWSADTASEFTGDHKDHFRAHWLDTPGTEEYLRGGFRAVLEHARDRNVELNAISFTAGDGDIQLGWVDNPSSVTIVIWFPRSAPKNVDPGGREGDPWSGIFPRTGGAPGI
jgi:hypothetical protein